jgi:hypothetical protein
VTVFLLPSHQKNASPHLPTPPPPSFFSATYNRDYARVRDLEPIVSSAVGQLMGVLEVDFARHKLRESLVFKFKRDPITVSREAKANTK